MSETMNHWAERYQEHTWQAGAEGPTAWDCWSFFRHVQAAHFGRAVPAVGVDASNIHAVAHAFGGHDERAHWHEVSAPAEGDAVLMAHSRYPSHVGVYLDVDGGGVLHCQNGAGVLFTPTRKLAACGWGRVSFFRPRGSIVDAMTAQVRDRIAGDIRNGQGLSLGALKKVDG